MTALVSLVQEVVDGVSIGPAAHVGLSSLRDWPVSSSLLWPKTMLVLLKCVGEAENPEWS